MSTKDEDFSLFDLESLLDPTPTWLNVETGNTSIITDVGQNLGLLESPAHQPSPQVSAQNDIDAANYYKAEFLKISKAYNDLNAKYLKCEESNRDLTKYKVKTKNLEGQYARVLKQFTDLQHEYEEANSKIKQYRKDVEQLTQEKDNIQQDKNAIDNRYSMLYIKHQASWSQIKQLTHLAEERESEKTKSDKKAKASDEACKALQRKYSSLQKKFNNRETECKIRHVSKLDCPTDIKNTDPEAKRQIKTSNKIKNADLESNDSESVDRGSSGRGSSYSFYSPAYSIHYGPLDTTDNFELKIMKDVSTSTSSLAPVSPSWETTASPIEFIPLLKYPDVTIPELTDITRPLEPADVAEWSTDKPPEIVAQTAEITRPFEPADVAEWSTDKPPEVVAQTAEITRPFEPVDVVVWSTDKPPEMYRSLDTTVGPRRTFNLPDITMQLTPTAVSKHTDLFTGPKDTNDVNGQSLSTKVSEMARPFETTDFVDQKAKTTTSEHVISLENNNISVISRTPDWTKLQNDANMRSSVIQSLSSSASARPLITTKAPDKTKQNENIKIFPPEKSLTKVLIENDETQVAQDNNKEMDDDSEITMIFNKFKIGWNALSPMSITPDLDEEGLVQSKSDLRNDETERQSPAHSGPQMCEESDALFVTPDYKKLTLPQNMANTLKPEINDENSSHLNKNKVPKSHTIPPITHTPVYNENERQLNKTKSNKIIEKEQSISVLASIVSSLESQSDLQNIRCPESNSLPQPSRNQVTQSQKSMIKDYSLIEKQIDSIVCKSPERIKAIIPSAQSKTKSVPQTQTKLQSSPIDNMPISKEPQSNTPKPPETRRSERIRTKTSAAQSKTKSVSQTQIMLQSSPIDNISISKEPQSILCTPPGRRRLEKIKSLTPTAQSKTKSVPQTQTILQLSPIDNVSIKKESQSILGTPPERRSERIKSLTPTAQSETKSVPQTQTKLKSSPIDNISISKEQQCILCTPPKRRVSERIKPLTPTAQSKTKSVPQTQSMSQSSPIDIISISKEPQSILCTTPVSRRSERIKSLTPTAQSKTKSVPQTRTMLQSSPIDNVSIKKEPQSILCTTPVSRRSERIKSLTPTAQSKTKSVPQTQTKLQSSPLANISISKEQQCILCTPREKRSEMIKTTTPPAQSKTKSVPQTQTILQLSPIDNISISKETQSVMHISPRRTRSEWIKSTTPLTQSERNSVPQAQMKRQLIPLDNMSITKEPLSNTPKLTEISERIKSTTPPAQSKTKLQLRPIDNMSISKEPQSNIRVAPERRSEMIKSISTLFERNRVPQAQMKLQLIPMDKMSITKEPQSNKPKLTERSERVKSTTLSAQSKTKLQLRPIDNMSISKEPQSNMHVSSEMIKSKTPSTLSERYSVPQAQMKLQSISIDKESISKKPQSNTRSGCAPIISKPEYGRKRTICRSMEAQINNTHSKRKKYSECDTSKLNSSEICSEDIFTNSYAKPLKTRTSRVKGSVSTNTKTVPNNKDSKIIPKRKVTETNHTNKTNNKDLTYTPPSKRAKLAHDKTNNKDGKNITDRKVTKNTKTSKTNNKYLTYTPPSKRAKLAHNKTGRNEDNIEMSITHVSTKNDSPDANLKSTSTPVPTWTTYKKNNPMAVTEPFQNECRRDLPDYNDLDIFDTENKNLKTQNDTHNQSDKPVVQYGSNRKNINKSKGRRKYEYEIAIDIEKAVAVCVSSDPNKYIKCLKEAVDKLKKHSAMSQLAGGFYKYLDKPVRKKEFVPEYKNRNYRLKPTPTKYVMSLMDIIDLIDRNGLKLWERVQYTCKYMLFRLDRAKKNFDVIESVTHLFVNMCQYDGRRNSKLIILFMLDAMYCANYRALIIIKNCLDLVPEILPHERQKEKILNSMNPLLQIFTFLLHFYNCRDQHKKIQHLRFTLRKRYGYDLTQENIQTILSKVKQTVLAINDHYLDNRMLQYSILLLAKRNGTEWCQKNIVKNIILPILKGEIYASTAAFRFCATIITRLIKPYTKEMKIHSGEVVNLLLPIIDQPHPQEMKDEIMCGLLVLKTEYVKLRLNGFFKNRDRQSMSPKLSKALNKFYKRQKNG